MEGRESMVESHIEVINLVTTVGRGGYRPVHEVKVKILDA